jgi:GT2 family glycosyltransferase
MLRRVLDHLDHQTAPASEFEVVVVADAKDDRGDELDAAVADRRYASRRLQADRPGASAARNLGWRSAAAPIVLFIDDDVLPERTFIAEHLAAHRRWAATEVGVLGRLRWADELRVTPFMRWVERGIQFDFDAIDGVDAGWGRFYTANASVKRELLERVDGFDESLPFHYEDLDLAKRMLAHGFRLHYNPAAVAEHLHALTIEGYKERMRGVGVAERAFVARHPDVRPYFHDLFTRKLAAPPARGRGARLAGIVSPGMPFLGPRVWRSADAVWSQTLGVHFMEGWEAAGPQ